MKKIQTVLAALIVAASANVFGQSSLYKKVDSYSSSLRNEFGQISTERKEKLNELANQLNKSNPTDKQIVLFASKDNSASSQLAQAWLQVAKNNYHLNSLQISSGAEQ